MDTGARAKVKLTVTEADTAIEMGSGDVSVLATPRLVALCEAAAVEAVAPELEAGQTTVGSHIELSHIAPTLVGNEVEAKAVLTEARGRKLIFDITATEGEKMVGHGRHTRFIVDRTEFLASAGKH